MSVVRVLGCFLRALLLPRAVLVAENLALRHHKTEPHDRERLICLGPRAQEVVRSFLVDDTKADLFSPKLAMDGHRANLRNSDLVNGVACHPIAGGGNRSWCGTGTMALD